MHIREPAVAGTFYPADPDLLHQQLTEMFNKAANQTASPKAIIVPHAGYIYSGELAARAYGLLQSGRQRIKTVVLLGPAHRVYFRGIAAPDADAFETPLGSIPVDQHAIAGLLDKCPAVQRLPEAHREEHCLEVQLPFLQEVLDDFNLIPLVVGDTSAGEVEKVIDYLWGDQGTLIVISSDLSHYHDYATAKDIDQQTARAIERLQPELLSGEMACGYLPVSGLLRAAQQRHINPERVGLCNSGDTAGSRDRVVGYGAWVLEEADKQQQQLSEAQKQALKNLALASIKHGLDEGKPLDVDEFDNAGVELPTFQAATFVTLKKGGQLRGCIGSLIARRPLCEDIADNAFAAAFRDHRFSAVTEDEIDDIDISVSLLTTPEPMSFTSEEDLIAQLQPGQDGLILSAGTNRGTFLPSVWEDLPDSASFLAHLKLKAGLPADYWSGNIKIERYKTVCW